MHPTEGKFDMKATSKTAVVASVMTALGLLVAGSAFAQVTAPGAGTTATPAMRAVPPHVDQPGDHPRGSANVKPNLAAGADDPQLPAKQPMAPHIDRPGDHPRGAPAVKPDGSAGADNPQTPAHVDKPGKGAHSH